LILSAAGTLSPAEPSEPALHVDRLRVRRTADPRDPDFVADACEAPVLYAERVGGKDGRHETALYEVHELRRQVARASGRAKPAVCLQQVSR
jgi:hypothetical protein